MPGAHGIICMEFFPQGIGHHHQFPGTRANERNLAISLARILSQYPDKMLYRISPAEPVAHQRSPRAPETEYSQYLLPPPELIQHPPGRNGHEQFFYLPFLPFVEGDHPVAMP